MTADAPPPVVEKTVRYATRVSELPAAWAFVMAHVDAVGADPTIEVRPTWTFSLEGEGVEASQREFEVVVEGMVEQPAGTTP